MKTSHTSYVLVTPAHNEKDFIELTIRSVLAQTVKPLMWVIISDRSSDGTDAIIKKYAEKYPFILFVRNEKSYERNTAAKVHAINIGLGKLKNLDYAYVGNLDADISFQENYFEILLQQLAGDEKLGITGGRIFQVIGDNRFEELKTSPESVAGAVQFFRKECFEQIGGYLPIRGGMEDGIAEITARYHGWKTRSIKGLPVRHHRELGTVGRSIWNSRFNSGMTEYVVGFSFLYHIIRVLFRVLEKPYGIGALVVFCGYMKAMLTRQPLVVSRPIIAYLRREQMARLWSRLCG